MQKRMCLALLCLGLAVFTMAFAACGDDDDDTGDSDDGDATTELNEDEQAAADYMDSLVELFNSGDMEAFVGEFTEPGLRAFAQDQDTPIDELREQAAGFLGGGDPVEGHEYQSIVATADTATVDIASSRGAMRIHEEFELVMEAGEFKVDGYTQLPVEIPAGAAVLDVTGTEFSYEFEGGDAEDGLDAIKFTNGGEQFHEIILFKASGSASDLDTIVGEALDSAGPEDLPDSLDSVVGRTFAGPGEGSEMVFRDTMEAARYIMLCFIPDETQGEEGPSHAALGMAAEFTIQ